MPRKIPTGRQIRFRAFVQGLLDSGVSQATVGAVIGCSQTMVSAIASEKKLAGEETIDKAQTSYGLHHDFFCDARASSARYQTFVGASPLRAEPVQRPRGKSPFDAIEDYIVEEERAGRKVSTEHAVELRGANFVGDVTFGMAASLHREMIARDRDSGEKKRRR